MLLCVGIILVLGYQKVVSNVAEVEGLSCFSFCLVLM
jgi:hypothetical protein